MKKPAYNEKEINSPVTNCRALRKKAKLSQAELAHAANVSLGVVWRMENAEDDETLANTRVASFIDIAEALGVTTHKLYPTLATKWSK